MGLYRAGTITTPSYLEQTGLSVPAIKMLQEPEKRDMQVPWRKGYFLRHLLIPQGKIIPITPMNTAELSWKDQNTLTQKTAHPSGVSNAALVMRKYSVGFEHGTQATPIGPGIALASRLQTETSVVSSVRSTCPRCSLQFCCGLLMRIIPLYPVRGFPQTNLF